MIMHRADQTATIRALRSAAPYIRMYKGKIFVVKVGGAVFGDPRLTRALIEQIAILHYLGRARRDGARRRPAAHARCTEALGVPTRMVQGRRVTDEKAIDVTAMVLNGLINTRLLAICRELRHRRGRALAASTPGWSGRTAARRCKCDRRPRPSTSASSATSTRSIQRAAQAARQRPDAGGQPAVGRRRRACCSTSTPTPWPRPSARRCGAEKLILCTGAPGILDDVADPGSLISYTDLAGLQAPARGGQRSRTACCRRPRPSRTRSAAACAACT